MPGQREMYSLRLPVQVSERVYLRYTREKFDSRLAQHGGLLKVHRTALRLCDAAHGSAFPLLTRVSEGGNFQSIVISISSPNGLSKTP
jgi:hypothetical protein